MEQISLTTHEFRNDKDLVNLKSTRNNSLNFFFADFSYKSIKKLLIIFGDVEHLHFQIQDKKIISRSKQAYFKQAIKSAPKLEFLVFNSFIFIDDLYVFNYRPVLSNLKFLQINDATFSNSRQIKTFTRTIEVIKPKYRIDFKFCQLKGLGETRLFKALMGENVSDHIFTLISRNTEIVGIFKFPEYSILKISEKYYDEDNPLGTPRNKEVYHTPVDILLTKAFLAAAQKCGNDILLFQDDNKFHFVQKLQKSLRKGCVVKPFVLVYDTSFHFSSNDPDSYLKF